MLAAVLLPASQQPAQALDPVDVPSIGADTGRFKLPIACQIRLGPLPVLTLNTDVDVQGVAPVTLGPGQEFWLNQGSGSITFPSWLTSLAPFAGIGTADAVVNDLSIGARNASPEAINIAEEDPFEIDGIPIRAGQELTVGLPLEGTFEVGPFTAPDEGTVTFEFVRAQVDVTLHTFFGPLDITADCRASQGNALLTVAVGGPAGQPPPTSRTSPSTTPSRPPTRSTASSTPPTAASWRT